jgi:hypothetical protein
MQILLKRISFERSWRFSLSKLFIEYPSVNTERLGFPKDWFLRDVWG